MLPQVVTYAAVLDRLNGAILKDWRVLDACHEIWTHSYDFEDYYNHFGAFLSVKYSLVEKGVEMCLSSFHSSSIQDEYGVWISINIAAAQMEDQRMQNFDNALAAEPLVLKAAAGPTQFASDGKTILFRPPLPQQWAELYRDEHLKPFGVGLHLIWRIVYF